MAFPDKVYLMSEEDTPAYSGSPGWVKRIITKERTDVDLTFSIAQLYPGRAHEWHSHDEQDEIIFIRQGEGTLSIEGEHDIKYHTGMVIIVPQGTRHQNTNTSEKPIDLVTIFTPALL